MVIYLYDANYEIPNPISYDMYESDIWLALWKRRDFNYIKQSYVNIKILSDSHQLCNV